MNKLWILLLLALGGCNSSEVQSPEAIAASCNTVVAGEKTDPGLACFDAEPTLPTAVQFGDSLSKAYSLVARHNLCGVVDYRHDAWDETDIDLCGEHYRPFDEGLVMDAAHNNGYAKTMLVAMERDLAGRHFNVVLFNSGYHDIQHGVAESVYRNNLEAIAQTCEQSADICIWVDTPALNAPSLPLAGSTITEVAVERYNAVARDVAREHGFYMLAMTGLTHDGSVHLSSRGYGAAGKLVSDCVLTALSQSRTEACHQD